MPTVKKLSYAGITIPLATTQLEEILAATHPQDIFRDYDGWNFDAPHLQSLPTPSIPTPPDFRIGVLTWPTGASRPAWFHFVTTTERLNLIKSAQGSTNSPQPLVMYDGRSGKTITASMWMLPERPLNHLGSQFADAWLITLTDIRFYWAWRRGDISQPGSWTHLFSQIASILGISLTVDAIDSRYLTPSNKWTLPYAGSTPTILDAAAAQVGQRVVVGLDGSVKTVNWESARLLSDFYISFSDPVISGGLIDEAGIARYVPSSARILFLDASTTPIPASPLVVTRTLTSLAISQYGAATGVTGYYQTLNGDVVYDGANGTAVGNYATAMAEDWYGWRLSDTDLVWPGIEPWEPTGWEDVVEWTFQKRDPRPFASTLVRRGPWNDFQSGDWYSGVNPDDIGSGSGNPSNSCGSGLVPVCVPEKGTGSGSGAGSGFNPGECDEAIETVTIETDDEDGTRTLVSKFIDVASENGRLVIEECSTQEYDLGPLDPDNPTGTRVPVAFLVCPIKTTLNYLDWDGEQQSIDVVTDIKVERKMITVPVMANATGCIISAPEDCCGSGSGGQSPCEDGCFEGCQICFPEMSKKWHFFDPDTDDEVILCHVINGLSACEFISEDMNWSLYPSGGMYVLENHTTNALYFAFISDWNCSAGNLMETFAGIQSVIVSPLDSCGIRWDCTDGECVEAFGGAYASREECVAAGCGATPIEGCCDFSTGWPATLNAVIVAKTADCSRTVTLTKSGSGTTAIYVSPDTVIPAFCQPPSTPPYRVRYFLLCNGGVLLCGVQVSDNNNISRCLEFHSVLGTCCPNINIFAGALVDGSCNECCGGDVGAGAIVSMNITGVCP